MERIQEGQPFAVFMECTDSPARLEKLFRHIRKILPGDGRIFSVVSGTQRKKALEEKLEQITERYCETVYFAPYGSSDESRQQMIEKALRRADFQDCVLILGRQNGATVREAARQLAYELDFGE